jgi:hypothetical protein
MVIPAWRVPDETADTVRVVPEVEPVKTQFI